MKEAKDKRAYPNGFYLIDNRISMHRLTPIELAVYNCICRHGNTHHLAHLRMATIANESGCAVSSARKAAHSLEDKQLIDISPDYAGPLQRGLHPRHLRPRHHRRPKGRSKNHGHRAARRSMSLPAHFRLWVSVWVMAQEARRMAAE